MTSKTPGPGTQEGVMLLEALIGRIGTAGCTGYAIEHVVASPVAPAGGSQGTGQDLATGGPEEGVGQWVPVSVGTSSGGRASVGAGVGSAG